MHISATEPSSAILIQTKWFYKCKDMPKKCQNKLKLTGMVPIYRIQTFLITATAVYSNGHIAIKQYHWSTKYFATDNWSVLGKSFSVVLNGFEGDIWLY